MREVAVIEHDKIAPQERVAEVPAEEPARGRAVRAHEVVCDARRRVPCLVLGNEVARVRREHLATDLERQCVAVVARQRWCGCRVCGKRWRDLAEDIVDDVLRATDKRVTSVDQCRDGVAVDARTRLGRGRQLLAIEEDTVDLDLPAPEIRDEY